MIDTTTASKDLVKRLGIMGGTFDPIHYGHLVAAETARVRFSLDQVVFVPSGRPPHKQNGTTDANDRLDRLSTDSTFVRTATPKRLPAFR